MSQHLIPNTEICKITIDNLRDVKINDYDTKSKLTVHVILGISDCTKIKTQQRARMGLPGEAISGLTKLGWFIVLLGNFSQTSMHHYEKRQFRLPGNREKHDDFAHEKFRKKLGCDPGDCYETNLIWKENHPSPRKNKDNRFGRMNNPIKKGSRD